ncbi:MAG: UvrD-helicase domain-containing protein, partial [Clostridia bacterium]|nr:UvrD-helicase domain-containing protein [Clostridia bacterium]
MEITAQQREAIESSGKVIVSASAGSGKTFVMIQKLVCAIENGVDLDSVLAVTFTKKAAAQMKEKLRKAIIGAMAEADKDKRLALKIQLSKIPSADISTIHSFCARLLRTYFYAIGIDGTFDIISSDDALAREYKDRAVSGMFERYYEEDDENFKTLLACFRRKRGDNYLKGLILSAYEELRIYKNYTVLLDGVEDVYTEEGFDKICERLKKDADEKYRRLANEVRKFSKEFFHSNPTYTKILEEMISTLDRVVGSDIFTPQPAICVTRKPVDKSEYEKALGEEFKKFKDGINSQYKAIRGDISDRQTERDRFFKSGITAKAFCAVMKDFDTAYTEIKRDENKLDYNDLEHLTLKLLENGEIKREVNSKYACVFVDEYQDVNPVPEEIIS